MFPPYMLAFKGTRNNPKDFIWTNLEHLDNVLLNKQKENLQTRDPESNPATSEMAVRTTAQC